ncbi:hypothetical protein F511_12560 [Dorcoceras hygrometricum]|uniref:Uncharacterized protein n=1 Tax=Dorcoceras hygrometricum TaxID=472368 RepID=A0A2Z7DAS8_9LAMI|nr:hypothetical protein F511_12560 [Dorcoceras hygrometricum]
MRTYRSSYQRYNQHRVNQLRADKNKSVLDEKCRNISEQNIDKRNNIYQNREEQSSFEQEQLRGIFVIDQLRGRRSKTQIRISQSRSSQRTSAQSKFRASIKNIKCPHLPMYDERTTRTQCQKLYRSFFNDWEFVSNDNIRPEALCMKAELMKNRVNKRRTKENEKGKKRREGEAADEHIELNRQCRLLKSISFGRRTLPSV